MERTQISLTEEQATRLRGLARQRHTSMAALIRDAVDTTYPETDDDERWQRFLAASGRFESGKTDISEHHDDYLAVDFGD